MNRIIRQKSDKAFTIIPNSVFNSGLSLRATGLLTYILHLPDDWILHKTYLYKTMQEGRDAVNSAWKELENAGYIETVIQPGGGRSKLPEINYIVYDIRQKKSEIQYTEIPHPINQEQNIPHQKIRNRKSKQLLSTNEQSTNVQSIPVIPTGITGPPQEDPPPVKPKNKKAAAQPKDQTAFQLFTASYDAFIRKINSVPPKYDKASGQATNSLLDYFKKIAKDRALRDNGGNDPGEKYIEVKAHEGWEYVLNNWHRLDNFLQGKTRLLDINSNIQNIITQLKNGHSKNKNGNSNGQPTGGGVTTSSLASAIAGHYAGAGTGQPGT